MKQYVVYILANNPLGTLYVGVTNNLKRRMYEHRLGIVDGFTKKYNVDKLVYFEHITDVAVAIAREKQLKGWLRAKKNLLVSSMNPDWHDLSEDWH